MEKRNIIVIGASAGGFEAIKNLVAALPPDFDATICIVWHMSPDVPGILPQVLNKLKSIEASHPIDKEPLRNNHIYVAPPDRHLLIEKDTIRVTRGPKENRFRPAVDPLFRSAAYAYGPRVIGIILSGALDDGTAGLWAIKDRGGIAIVQLPEDAEVASMPLNALQSVRVDYKLPVAEMPELLSQLIREPVPAALNEKPASYNDRTQTEIKIAMEDDKLKANIFRFGEPSPYTCPDCHGVLLSLTEGDRTRFRCHTGHAFSADSLLAAITENIEESYGSVIRNVRESVMLLNHLGDHFAEINQPKLAAMYFRKAKEAEKRANIVREVALTHEQLTTESIHQQSEKNDPGPKV